MVKNSIKSVHEAEPLDESGSVVTPIYQTSTFSFSAAKEAALTIS